MSDVVELRVGTPIVEIHSPPGPVRIAVAAATAPNIIRTSTAVTVTVAASGGDYTSIQDAIDGAGKYHFDGGADYTIELDDAAYALSSPLSCSHPQGHKIHIVSTGTAASATARGDLGGTKATDLAALEAKYPCVITCTGKALDLTAGQLGTVRDILFKQASATTVGLDISGPASCVTLVRCGFFGFTQNIQASDRATISGTGPVVCAHSSSRGVYVERGAAILVDTLQAFYAGAISGIYAISGGDVIAATKVESCDNTGNGAEILVGSLIRSGNFAFEGNSTYGLSLSQGEAYCDGTTNLSDNAVGVSLVNQSANFRVTALTVGAGGAGERTLTALNTSHIWIASVSSGTPVYSPAANTEGNNNAFIQV